MSFTAEDIDENKSLERVLQQERKTMGVQYYNHNNPNYRSRSNHEEDEEDATSTMFITAPHDYDPYVTGFINPKSSEYYESDEEDEEEGETRDTSLTYSSESRGVSTEASKSKISNGPDIGVALSFSSKGERSFRLKAKKQSRSLLKEQDSFEPSVEVVINERSSLWNI